MRNISQLLLFAGFIIIISNNYADNCTAWNGGGGQCTNWNITNATQHCACLECNNTLVPSLQGAISCCLPSIANCSACNALFNCAYCISGMGFNSSSICTTCTDNNCLVCYSNYTICTYCKSGYTLVANASCIICSLAILNCLTCQPNSFACRACVNNSYIIQNNSCLLCQNLDGCIGCFASRCVLCDITYYLFSGGCSFCNNSLVECITCSSSSTCLTCTSSYILLINNTCGTCLQATNSCLICTNSTFCTGCLNSSYYLSSAFCYHCNVGIPDCWTCSDNQTCTQCVNDSYYLTTICNPCNSITNCSACSDNQTCTKCINNYYLNNSYCQSCLFYNEFCIDCNSIQCLSCTNIYYYLQQNLCYLCGNVLPNCQFCTNNTNCIRCKNSSFVLFNSHCYLCGMSLNCPTYSNGTMYISCGLGLLVKSGCTRVKGCLVVNPMSFNLSSNCLSCNSTQFYPNPINNICVCKEGWLIGEYCGNIVGCTQLYFNISIFVCTSCNINNRFILINGTCFCKPYYALSQSTCLEICGDGYLFMLACDDGNLLDGDGCSSTCQVEANYVCRPRLQLPMSQCVFKGRVTLELSRISRLPNSNSATIAFDIIPFESVITKMNFKSLTNFTADSCQTNRVEIVNKQLIVTFSFNKTVTDEQAYIRIQFDKDYIRSPSFTSSYKLILSNGGQFIYYQNIKDLDQNLVKIIQILSFLILGAFAAGSLAYRMIGVQTIHTYQIILLLIVNSKTYPYLFVQLSNLKVPYGQLLDALNSKDMQFVNQQRLADLGYTEFSLQDYLALAVLETIIVLAYCIISLYCLYTKNKLRHLQESEPITIERHYQRQTNQKNQQHKDNRQTKITTLKRRLEILKKILICNYNWFLFPLLIGFMFHFLMTLAVHDIFSAVYPLSLSFKIMVFSMLMIGIGKYSVFVKEFLFADKQNTDTIMLKPAYCHSYIPIYLLNFLLLLTTMIFQLMRVHSFIQEISLAIIALKLIYIIMKRPYQRSIHNLAIMVNQSLLTFVVGWLICEKYFVIAYATQRLLLMGLIGGMTIVLILSLVRTIFTFWQLYCRQSQAEAQVKVQNKSNPQPNIVDSAHERKKIKNQNFLFQNKQKAIIRQRFFDQYKDSSNILSRMGKDNKSVNNKSKTIINNQGRQFQIKLRRKLVHK